MIRVLIVEDEPHLLEMFSLLYVGLGCDVTTCSTVVEAERNLVKGTFHIVHLDDNLTAVPRGSPLPHQGSRILASIALEKGYKVIGCSAELVDEQGHPLWPEGVTAIMKPFFSLNEFKKTVGQVIAGLGS